MNIRRTILAQLIIPVLMLCQGASVTAATEENTNTVASDQQAQSKGSSVATGENQDNGTKIPPKPVDTKKVASPKNFIPTEGISQDLSVSFPVDI